MYLRLNTQNFEKPLKPIVIFKDDPYDGFEIHLPPELVPYLTMDDIAQDRHKLIEYACEAALTNPYMMYVKDRMELIFSD